jgi:hypothetical protein
MGPGATSSAFGFRPSAFSVSAGAAMGSGAVVAEGRRTSPGVLEVPELILTSAPVVLLACSDENLFRFVFPQGQIVAPNFDFNRVAQRRKADQFHFGSH